MLISLTYFFPCGYLVWISFVRRFKEINDLGFVIILPFCFVVGMGVTSVVVLLLIDLGIPLDASIISIPIASTILVGLIYRKEKIPVLEKLHDSIFNFDLRSTIALLLLGQSLYFFSSLATIMNWPPAGDPASLGTQISLVLYDQGIPKTFLPISSTPLTVLTIADAIVNIGG